MHTISTVDTVFMIIDLIYAAIIAWRKVWPCPKGAWPKTFCGAFRVPYDLPPFLKILPTPLTPLLPPTCGDRVGVKNKMAATSIPDGPLRTRVLEALDKMYN